MKQGNADSNTGSFKGKGLTSRAYGTQALYGARPPDGQKREPNTRAINPGYTNMLGNMVGDHVTEVAKGTGYRGDTMYRDRKKGFEAPRNVSQTSTNKGSQGSY